MKTQEQGDNKQESNQSEASKREQKILAFWNENKIFEKSVNKPAGKELSDPASGASFVFFDGPPFATGTPHFGHILASAIKDAVPRYWTMKGKRVERKWGWDCHGLPIENIAEKELGVKEKKEILEMGIEKFNDTCKSKIFGYVSDWKNVIARLGRWADMENAYSTMDASYMESIWWVFKELWDKGLIYESYRSMHICPRCETTLSQQEVSENYKDLKDVSVFVKFELVDPLDKGGEGDLNPSKTYILAWTTTPWTLPGNVALAVGEEIMYVDAKTEDGRFIIAKARLKEVMGDKKYEVVGKIKGIDLVGKKYKPVFDYYSKDEKLANKENGWKIYGADFVNTEDGTGVVHIAPAFGEDDMNLGKKENLPFIQHVKIDGKFDSGFVEFMKERGADFTGMSVKPKDTQEDSSAHLRTDIAVIKWLQDNGHFFAKENITHSYPHCWRCDTPLLNYATTSWFVNVLKIKDRALELAKGINWSPENMKEGRFGNWLAGARDWSISRQRFWASAMPIWKCEKCGDLQVVGSVEELKKRAPKSGNKFFLMRHGWSENNELDIANSKIEKNHYHLTEKGRQQVEESSRAFKENGGKIDMIFSSDFLRAQETAEIVADILNFQKDKIIFDKRLREPDLGDFEGRKSAEYHGYFSSLEEKFVKNTPNGGNLTELKRRIGDFLRDIDGKFSGKNILAVGHEYPHWMAGAAAAGFNPKEAIAMRNDSVLAGYLENGQIKEIEYLQIPRNKDFELDLHRPYVDEIKLKCAHSTSSGQACDGEAKRIPDVLDTWFDSGSMPYAQNHYPFENKEKFEKNFPAEFIGEGVDQTRAWFYYLHVVATSIKDSIAFKNVIVNGILLAEDGQKMSKKLKNYPDPMVVIEKYGADALRYYLLSSPAVRAESINFSEKNVDEVNKKVIARLLNVLTFYKTYAHEELGGRAAGFTERLDRQVENILDTWIIARLNQLIKETTEAMERYELDKATRPIADFIDDLSNWYIRRSRDRFKEENEDRKSAEETTRFVLIELSKVIAPFMPFLAEFVYGELVQESSSKLQDFKESVHLEEWPAEHGTWNMEHEIEEPEILQSMQEVRKVSSLALEARAKAGIKVRQPLQKLKIKNEKLKISDGLIELIKDEVNVKDVVADSSIESDVELDTNITPELKAEGMLREVIRGLQDLRKKAGLTPSDIVELIVEADEAGKKFLEKSKEEIKKAVRFLEIKFGTVEKGEEIKADEVNFKAGIKK